MNRYRLAIPVTAYLISGTQSFHDSPTTITIDVDAETAKDAGAKLERALLALLPQTKAK